MRSLCAGGNDPRMTTRDAKGNWNSAALLLRDYRATLGRQRRQSAPDGDVTRQRKPWRFEIQLVRLAEWLVPQPRAAELCRRERRRMRDAHIERETLAGLQAM